MSQKNEAFKHLFGVEHLKRLSQALAKQDPEFKPASFAKNREQLDGLEMKARVQWISDALNASLPHGYAKTLKILVNAAQDEKLIGFDLWPIAHFIQCHGLKDPRISLLALSKITSKFTAEFAVRPYLRIHPNIAHEFFQAWAKSEQFHLRRLASEGMRTRLPWGEQLAHLIANPASNFEILELLKFDPELYVRKSVANHLSDLAKDHPEKVIERLKAWQKRAMPAERDRITWVIRRSLRNLIKSGDARALALLGVNPKPKLSLLGLKISRSTIKIGSDLNFEFLLHSRSAEAQKLIVDYRISFVKSRGQVSAKVFKLKTFVLDAREEKHLQKKHSFKLITTRTYFSGMHRLEIQVNGLILAATDFLLTD